MKPTATLDLNTLGGQITWRRQCAGFSLNDLSRRTGVSKGYLSQIENGKASRPGVYAVQRIAIALGVSIEALIGVPPEDSRAAGPPAGARSGEDA